MSNSLRIFHKHQIQRLILVFVGWKIVMFSLVALCPGPGYDTSGFILLTEGDGTVVDTSIHDQIALKLLRWDALYFAKAAQRGYLYEQEWAFSSYCSGLFGKIVDFLTGSENNPLKHYVWSGILVSVFCHLISVTVLYLLARTVLGAQYKDRIPFIAAILHVISPAGMFLTAPYGESLFSALNFAGMLFYALARRAHSTPGSKKVAEDFGILASGALFAIGTLIRSNGLLSGLIFLYDAASFVPQMLTLQLRLQDVRRLFITCVAGGTLACGYIIPQLLAYQQFCGAGKGSASDRPWCSSLIPSIYTWVQDHYWNVGFLRYWTMSNLPLFLMAAPMLWLLVSTSVTILREVSYSPAAKGPTRPSGVSNCGETDARFCDFPQLVIPQLVLAVAATTNFHVQIINRISSGYPVWYLVVAKWLLDEREGTAKKTIYSKWTVRGMVMYALIQGMLFAGFLPPA